MGGSVYAGLSPWQGELQQGSLPAAGLPVAKMLGCHGVPFTVERLGISSWIATLNYLCEWSLKDH